MVGSEQNASHRLDGWVEVGSVGDIEREDVKRFDHGDRTFAIYCAPDGQHYATDGICTHEYAHLANGLVMGNIVECPKHNGRPRARRFALTSRSTRRRSRAAHYSSSCIDTSPGGAFAPELFRSGRGLRRRLERAGGRR
jgi:MocE subfamily Rieske [2Fe-2S] domain protein